MKIIVDAFGGDNAPLEILKGCAQAVEKLDVDIMLTGREDEIRRVAQENAVSLNRMEIIDAPDVITMEDHAGEIMKSKTNCSMAEGLRRLTAGEGDAFISAGNSGALVVGATLIVKRIKGIKRVAFAPIMRRRRFLSLPPFVLPRAATVGLRNSWTMRRFCSGTVQKRS